MRLVSWKELKSVYGVPYTPQHVHRLEAAGSFPRRLKLGKYRGARVVWLAEEIEGWIKARLEQRSSE